MDLVGSTLGKYQILAKIGAGGMGVVYRAFHPGLQVEVAIKALAEDLATDAGALARFRRECTLLARLHHPGLVPIQDCDTFEGIPYYVMPLVSHPTLEALLTDLTSRGELLPISKVLSVTTTLLAALEVVHAADIIHRDIKPPNIFVDDGGNALLTDFGVAKTRNDMDLTGTGQAVGTWMWMAPEQMESGVLDARTDLYQVGLVLHRMLDGSLPYSDVTAAVKVKCLGDGLPAPQLRGAPSALADVVDRLTRRDPAGRFPTAAAARRALGEASSATRRLRPASARQAKPVGSRPPDPSPSLPKASDRDPRRLVAGSIAAAVLVLAGVGVFRTPPAPTPLVATSPQVTPTNPRPSDPPPPVETSTIPSPTLPVATPTAGPSASPRRPPPSTPAPSVFPTAGSSPVAPPGKALAAVMARWPGAASPPRLAELRAVFDAGTQGTAVDALVTAVTKWRAVLPKGVVSQIRGARWSASGEPWMATLVLTGPLTPAQATEVVTSLTNLDGTAHLATLPRTRSRGEPVGARRLVPMTEALMVYLSLLYPGFHDSVATGLQSRIAGLDAAVPASPGPWKPGGFRGKVTAGLQRIADLKAIDEAVRAFLCGRRD